MLERVTLLLEKQLAGTLSRPERWELQGLILEPALQDDIRAFMEAAWTKTGEDIAIREEKLESFFRGILESKTLDENKRDTAGEAEVTPLIEMEPVSPKRAGWKRWMIAASIIGLLGLGSYFVFFNKSGAGPDETIAKTPADVEAPKGTKATITLGDGRKMYLDSMNSGVLATQGNIKLVKLPDGQIAYQSTTGESLNEIQYNTLSNPRGSKVIDMALTDGSHVWLNAGSSITYPIVFAGDERKVQIDGEAYFEVAHNPAMPFKVTKGKMEIAVLGTHFNVNTYEDESDIRVTLLEGAVNVSNGNLRALLKPGQQARITSEIKLVNGVDIDLVMAWKNGVFSFEGASLEEMMREIARWYDVTVTYKGTIPDRIFGGKIYRDANLSKVLEILEESNVHYQINNKVIEIFP